MFALQTHRATLTLQLGKIGMRIEISGPQEGLPALPAAVEANAYRIALEALTNATRHAQAQHCRVQFACESDAPHGTQITAGLPLTLPAEDS